MTDKLTAKQQRFVDEYAVCLNGTEAARRAKYDGDDATLAVIASNNLRKVNVANAVSAKLAEQAMPRSEVLAQLTDIARGDIADVINAFGATDIEEAKRRVKSHLVKKYKIKVTRVTEGVGTPNPIEKEIVETEIELYSKLEALQTLAKYYNLTNTVKVEDWRSELIALIREGKVRMEDVQEEFGVDVAEELFITAGVLITSSGEDETVS